MPGKLKIANNTLSLGITCFALFILSICSLLFSCIDKWIPLIGIGIINIYLLSLLFLAAIISDKKDWFLGIALKIIPTRFIGLLMFFSFFITIVIFFGAVYYKLGTGFKVDEQITNPLQALYFSLLTLTTLGFQSPTDSFLQGTVAFEILSAVNLFFGSFALLVSRFSNF